MERGGGGSVLPPTPSLYLSHLQMTSHSLSSLFPSPHDVQARPTPDPAGFPMQPDSDDTGSHECKTASSLGHISASVFSAVSPGDRFDPGYSVAAVSRGGVSSSRQPGPSIVCAPVQPSSRLVRGKRVPVQPLQRAAYCFTFYPSLPGQCESGAPAEFSLHVPVKPDFIAYLIAQEEKCPDSGRYHLQGYLELVSPLRITAFKKLGYPWDVLHLEARKGTQQQAIDYCKKAASQVSPYFEFGTPKKSGVSPAYQQFIAALHEGADVYRLRSEFLGQYLRHKRAADELLRDLAELRREDVWCSLEEAQLRPWQLHVLGILRTRPSDRAVHWFFESVGGSGKSTFAKYLYKNHGAIVPTCTAQERVLRAYRGESVIVFDISRADGLQDNVGYSILETMKNCMGFSTMYDPGMKIWKPAHVFVFSNFPPNFRKLSVDRWDVYEIQPDFSCVSVPVHSSKFLSGTCLLIRNA